MLPAEEDFFKNRINYISPEHIDQVKSAYLYAKEAHEGQQRRSGEPYITHPLAVAEILANMNIDYQSLMAAMLHDVIEDTAVTKHTLAKLFGEKVAELVDGVSKLDRLQFESLAEAQAENLRKMTMAMAKDLRVILIKLADRLHNMRTLHVLTSEKRRRIARETLEIYAPIANRLGMNDVRVELEDLCFAAIYPMRAERIRRAVKLARGNRRELLEKIKKSIENCLQRETLQAEVCGREKHLYSMYQKMKSKHKSFAEIMDVYAFRIIVDSVDMCYRVLGAVHNLYKPVPGRFKDYIAIPKSNGYQSLHTILFGMHGVPIEIQIRTHAMEAMANYGIAAHWLYKSEEKLDVNHVRAREWLKGLLDMQKQAGNSLEFIEHMKVDLFPDEIYVFTPNGEILELPKNSTAVDFAYAVHTGIGNSCVACRIDRRVAPLSTQLQNGQTIEVMRSDSAHPNPAWLNFVVTAKARSHIRHYLKQKHQSEVVNLGKRMLSNALASFHKEIHQLDEQHTKKALIQFNVKSLDELCAEIGLGVRMAYLVAMALVNKSETSQEKAAAAKTKPLAIKGTEGLVISYAKCCHPIPGDPITGHLSVGRGLVVHTSNCKNILGILENKEKCLEITWDEAVSGEFTIELKVELENARGIIAELATIITSYDASIEKIDLAEKDERISSVRLTLGVKNRVHLANVIKKIRTLNVVERVSRIKNYSQKKL